MSVALACSENYLADDQPRVLYLMNDTSTSAMLTSNGNTNRDTGGSVFTVRYFYPKETAEAARSAVMDCSGPQPIE